VRINSVAGFSRGLQWPGSVAGFSRGVQAWGGSRHRRCVVARLSRRRDEPIATRCSPQDAQQATLTSFAV
jgi:hypothetical protein